MTQHDTKSPFGTAPTTKPANDKGLQKADSNASSENQRTDSTKKPGMASPSGDRPETQGGPADRTGSATPKPAGDRKPDRNPSTVRDSGDASMEDDDTKGGHDDLDVESDSNTKSASGRLPTKTGDRAKL